MLDGKTAIITGGASGIGRATAIEFADYGAKIVIADLRPEPLEEGTDTHELVDGEFVRTDVSDPEDVRTLVDTVAERAGLDVIVNNAGISPAGRATDIDVDDWHTLVDVHLNGVFYGCKYAIPHLLERDGAIINIASVAGIQATQNAPGYSASKAGIINLTRQLALDYAGEGVRANAIAPGPIETAMFSRSGEDESDHAEKIQEIAESMPDRPGRPEDVGKAAVFLASDLAAYVNGHTLVVDGALTTKYY